MVWSKDLDTLESNILEFVRTGKLSKRTGRAAQCYSLWRIGADIGLASEGQRLIEQPNQLLVTDQVVRDKTDDGVLTLCSHSICTASADAEPGIMIDQL